MTADTHPVAVSDQADEIARQFALLSRVEWVRTITTCITYGMMSMFLPVLIWQMEHPFAKAIAIGAVTMTLLQLTTVRAIHLPYGLMGWGVVGVVTLLGNGVYWLGLGDLHGLALSSLAACGAIAYTYTAMRSNPRLHTELMRRGKVTTPT